MSGRRPPTVSAVGILIKTENDRYIFVLAFYFGEIPPRQPNLVRAYLTTLATPVLADIHDQMIPITEPASYRFKSNLRRYFSRASRLPEGLLFAGDVVCSFDPVLGQGMTAATLQCGGS